MSVLAVEQQPAIILANTNLNSRQIDVILALDNLTLVIEAKGYSRPIYGEENGSWQVQLVSGKRKDFPNPYLQTLGAQLALRDAMRSFLASQVSCYPSAALVFVPDIPAGSSICSGDFKVSIESLASLGAALQKKTKGCWNLTQWRNFARHHHLIPVATLEAAFDPALLDAEALLTAYSAAYSRMYDPVSKELIGFACGTKGQEFASEEVITQVCDERKDILLRGPSGCGKTLLAARIGINWIKQGGVPFIIPVKDYQGRLKDVLSREAGLLGLSSSNKLFEASRQLNRPILLILDGYNECPELERIALTRSISALAGMYEANVLVTSQIPVARPDLLALHEVGVYPPRREVKLAIAQKTAGCTITPEVELLLDSVESGLEAALVGEAGQQIPKGSSRYALFDTFTRKRLGSSATDGIRLLSRIANWLVDHISFSFSLRDLDRLLDAEQLSPFLLTQLYNTKMLITRGDRVSFRHELFFNAFAAEAVIRRAAGHADAVLAALARPRHTEYKEMIIGAIDDDVLLQQVLTGITDSRDVASCLSGICGRRARLWTEAHFPKVIQRMKEETEKVRFMITDQGWMNVAVDPETLEKWSDLDRSFIFCLPELLAQGCYLGEMLDVVATMDRRIAEETNRLHDQARERKIPIRSPLFAITYALQHATSIGLSHVCSHLNGFFRISGSDKLSGIIREKLAGLDLTLGQLYLLLALCFCHKFTDRNILTAPLSRQLIERFWTKAPYHLQLELLQTAGLCWDAEQSERTDLIAAIEALPQTKNIFLSTAIMDALLQLGAYEAPEQEQKLIVRDQIEKLLSRPKNKETCTTANHIFYAQFDHPLSTAYREAVSELSENERKRLLMMAAAGADDSILFLPLLIFDLVSFGDPAAGEIISRWTIVPPMDSCMPQVAIEAFVLAHIALARLGCLLPEQRVTSDNPAAVALSACGTLLYWSNRTDMAEDDRRTACQNPLNLLLKNAAGVATDVVRHCDEDIQLGGTKRLPGTVPVKTSILSCFPKQVTTICRQALQRPHIQTGYFRVFLEHHRQQVLNFALNVLGRHGNESDLLLLRQFSDDPNLGQNAIRAIKNLEQRATGAS